MTEVKVHEKSDVSGLFLEDMEMSLPDELGIMAVRNLIVFPGLLQPLTVGRPRSLALVQDAAIGNKLFAIVAQKDGEKEDPKFADLYKVGCAVRILKLIKLPDGTRNVVVQALSRIRMLEEVSHDPFFKAHVEQVPDIKTEGTELDALTLSTRQQIVRIIELSPQVPKEASLVVANIEDPGHLADFIATNLNMEMAKRQHFLETADVRQRLSELTDMMRREIDVLELAGKIQSDARANIEKTQREYYLREQLKAIQRELGEEDEKGRLVTELRGKIEAADMPSPVEVEAKRELSRLESMPMQAADFNVARTYLEYLVELPWAKSTVDRLNITEAQRILNKDHYGLKKPKKRIVEFLAVRKLKKDPKGPILCFVGPPGVGKTSLGQSIARAMGRKFVRVSLGGMHDEAEIRGHRRTYVGALPGRIIQELRKLQTNNPVFMLDEIDKLGVDFRGDPTSALLEVLDPEQNHSFTDHYLNVPFDLSHVLFIGTANLLDPVPPALRDRMEVIHLVGYVEEEKVEIAKRYLLPKNLEAHGLKKKDARFTDGALRKIISSYTREAGVRNLEREIAAICRSVARSITQGRKKPSTVDQRAVLKYLGPERVLPEVALRTSIPGVATGLTWTPAGGDIIFIEATTMRGSGKLLMTGQVGDVMRESAQAALSYVRSHAESFGIDPMLFRRNDIHIHVPAGAVPKDGPSGGIAIYSALVSLLTGKSIRPNVAMTGEITLRGLILPVGGIKEKVLAAKRAGIDTVILPERNRNDLKELPAKTRRSMHFHYLSRVDDVLSVALADGHASPKRANRERKKGKGRPARPRKRAARVKA